MIDPADLARWESRARPLLTRLPPGVAVALYSRGRTAFLARFLAAEPPEVEVPAAVGLELWGLRFRGPLWNAAGLFKDGRGYRVAARSGAGAFLAGTSTHRFRKGNVGSDGVRWPFAPYPRSGAASNWLGLPNPGHAAVAAHLGRIERRPGCPIGASVALDPIDVAGEDRAPEVRIEELARGISAYLDAGVDFLELNESCPNTGDDAAQATDLAALRARLERLLGLLPPRPERAPIVVKLSTDLDPAAVPALVDLLLEVGCDGLNLGNTSTDYRALREDIAPRERRLYDRFTGHYGGGVSGRPLAGRSLRLAAAAVERVHAAGATDRFPILRTGGIESAEAVRRSLDAGVAACQWYTGYFEALARRGWRAYPVLFAELAAPRAR